MTGSIGSPGASTAGTRTPSDVRLAADITITEFAYGGKASGATSGTDGEYVELTNTGGAPQDLTGWTYDNSAATAATGLSLTGLGTVAPGESVIVTDLTAAEFRTEWGLVAGVKVLSNGKTHTLNSGPNSIHVYDSTGTEVDSVSYASGFLSAKGLSAWVDAAHAGAGAGTTGWTVSTVGDPEGSWTSVTGSVGSPAASTLGTRTPADVHTGGGPVTPPTDPNYADIVINEITSNNSGNGFAPLDADDLIEALQQGRQRREPGRLEADRQQRGRLHLRGRLLDRALRERRPRDVHPGRWVRRVLVRSRAEQRRRCGQGLHAGRHPGRPDRLHRGAGRPGRDGQHGRHVQGAGVLPERR